MLHHSSIATHVKMDKGFGHTLVLYGEEAFDHAQIKRLPESPWSGDQCNVCILVPPLTNKPRLILIEIIAGDKAFKVLPALVDVSCNGNTSFIDCYHIICKMHWQ